MILVTCDTLRADRLGVYGYLRKTSPNVDAFARDAIVFDEAYSAAPLTTASLSSLLSGRLPEEIGVGSGNKFLMPAEVLTLAEVLTAEKIATAAVVSNRVLRRPKEKGDVGVQQGFVFFNDTMMTKEKNGFYERVASDTTQAAIAWLQSEKAKGDDRFFLWVHYQDPHGPYVPSQEHWRPFDRPVTNEPPLAYAETHKGKGKIPQYQKLEGEHRPEAYRIRYDGEIHYFDEAFGGLLAWLRHNGWYEDSLIIFSADHGESLGEHDFWFCHGENLNREVVRVPLIVRFPAAAAHVEARADGPYRRVSTVAGHLDLWPTILEAFGVSGPRNRGTSLFSTQLPEGRIMPQSFNGVGTPEYAHSFGDGRYRVVADPGQPVKLFDIRSDPFETTDIAPTHDHPVRELTERYQSFVALHALPSVTGVPVDAEALKDLKALGYVSGGDQRESARNAGKDPK